MVSSDSNEPKISKSSEIKPVVHFTCSHRNVLLPDYLKGYKVSIEYCEARLCKNMQGGKRAS